MAKRKNQGRRKSHVAGSSHDAPEDVDDRHTAPEDVEDRHTRLHASNRNRRVKGRFGEDQDVGGTSDEDDRHTREMTPEPSRQTTPEPSREVTLKIPQSLAESEHVQDHPFQGVGEPEVDVEPEVVVEPEVDVELEEDVELEGAQRDEMSVQTDAPFPRRA